MTLSILHRITGLLLCLGAVVLIAWIATVSAGPEAHGTYLRVMRSIFGQLLILGLVFSLLFHLCNGVRHLVWDTGHGFEIRTMTITGWTVVALSVIGTLIAAWCMFSGATP